MSDCITENLLHQLPLMVYINMTIGVYIYGRHSHDVCFQLGCHKVYAMQQLRML